jgi:hypothetical protein
MSFTNAEKVQIRLSLGWPNQYFQTDSKLEMSILAIESDADATTLARLLLAQLLAIDTSLTDSYKRIKANEVGSIVLPGFMEIKSLRSEGKRIVGRMAAIFGVGIKHDIYAGYADTIMHRFTVVN